MVRDPTNALLKNKYGKNMGGASNKLSEVCQFHVGDMVTALQKCSLVAGGTEVLLYSTLGGSIGCFVPFSSAEDIEYFSHLEMHMRQEHPPLCGRDHMSYRSYYFPVKNVIDGDLLEQYNELSDAKQRSVGEELVSTPAEVSKRLEEIRNRVL